MARYGKEHKQTTRRRIIEAAGRRLKRDGIDGSGVATLMADAGLTNGAFYAHFDSKEDLVASTVADQLREERERYSTQSLEEIVRGYLSPQHRACITGIRVLNFVSNSRRPVARELRADCHGG